jgi:hypothetical protein
MELDVKGLLSQYHTLLSQYSSLEEVQMNLFNNLSNIYGLDWIDGNSQAFGRSIELDRNETDSFRICIWEKIGIFQYIYGKYCVLGKNIRCNLKKKDYVLSSVDSCINSVKSVNSFFETINLGFIYPEFNTLRSKKQLLIEMSKKLDTIKESLVSLYTKIEEIENDIQAKIRELEDIKINSFDFAFGSKGTSFALGAFLQDEMFMMDFAKLNVSSVSENSSLMKLYDSMFLINSLYKSDNIPLFQADLRNYKKNVDTVFKKRNSYLKLLSKVPTLYGTAATNTISTFEGADFND